MLRINSAPLRSTSTHTIHIQNRHDPGTALVHNAFALTVR